jgi:thioredoxin-related protein
MDRETYTNAEVIAALNQDFVCVKFNPEVEKTHSFGKYNLKSQELLYWLANGQPGGYPTSYFIFNPAKNDKRASQAGYLPPDQFLNLLGEVIKRKKQSE